MDRTNPEYSQPGLNSPVHQVDASNALPKEQTTETSSVDQASAAHYNPDGRANANGYSSTATPNSDYGVHPTSARSGSFPDHVRGGHYPPSNYSGSSGSMTQQAPSPSLPLPVDGKQNPQALSQPNKSDVDVPIDPSIATSSPSYPPQYNQHSPYPPQDGMTHGYPHPQAPMYAQPRPDWAGYGQTHPQQHGMPPYPMHGHQEPTVTAPTNAQRPGGNVSVIKISIS